MSVESASAAVDGNKRPADDAQQTAAGPAEPATSLPEQPAESSSPKSGEPNNDPSAAADFVATENNADGAADPKPVEVELPLSSFGLSRHFRTIDISPDKCLLPAEKLDQSPSRTDGMSVELERELRYLGCELIQSASILLQLPQVAAATGQILYQRYFYSKSFVRTNFEHVAMACVNLASKIEESPRRPRDVINVFHHLKQLSKCRLKPDRKPHPLVVDKNYSTLKNNVIKSERRVLNVLGFCVHVKHPHKLITAYLRALCCLDDLELIQLAWNYMNDGLRTDIFLRFAPETIACACIFLAARMRQVPLPEEPHPWCELFDATLPEVESIALILLRMYKRKKSPSWSRIDRQMSELQQQYEATQRATQVAAALSAVVAPPPVDASDTTNDGKPSNNGRPPRGAGSRSASSSPDEPYKAHRDRSRPESHSRRHHKRARSKDNKPSGGGKSSVNGVGSDPKQRDSRRRRRSSSSPRSPLKSRSANKDASKRLNAKYGNLVRDRGGGGGSGGGSRRDRDHSSSKLSGGGGGGGSSRRRGGDNMPKPSRSPQPLLSNRLRTPASRSPPPAVKRPKPSDSPLDKEKQRQIRKQREREVVGVLGKRRRPSMSPDAAAKR